MAAVAPTSDRILVDSTHLGITLSFVLSSLYILLTERRFCTSFIGRSYAIIIHVVWLCLHRLLDLGCLNLCLVKVFVIC